MAVRPIICIPDPVLKKVSEPIETIDSEVQTLLDDMLETMYEAPGIGLAAVQIGITRRIAVVDCAKEEEPKNPIFLINPEIVWSSEEKAVYQEGCLSIPEYYEDVERPAQVRVRHLDRDGKIQEFDADGLLATCVQHEIDHLNGVLFIDYLSRLKRDRVVKKFAKAAKRDSAA
ncbi:MAG: peptide deformylase [Pseudomonadota bacterium]